MRALLLTIAVVSGLTIPADSADDNVTYSRKEQKQMIKNAHSREEHEKLAEYFHSQERMFRAREAEQRELLSEYYKAATNHSAKYPTKGDSARHSASYFNLQAQKASDRALEQERLAPQPPPRGGSREQPVDRFLDYRTQYSGRVW